MSNVFFLVLRRLRIPLALLVMVYAIATLGMTLIPGIDPNGQPWHMSFFHAFYFVSITATTIGFGEIPYPFTDTQRAWALICAYTSVVAWLYAIGNILRLLQDPTFKNAIAERTFARNIKDIGRPFYIICGYGETGMFINQGLSQLGIQTVIIDRDHERTNSLELEDLSLPPIILNADTTDPRNLVYAGLHHSKCAGIIAVTENDHTNLKVAVASKLLNENVPVICRSEIQDEADNMASFGTNVIINPFLTFANRLNLMAHDPSLHQIQNWFINQHSAQHLTERLLPKGRWIICGFGRLGKSIEATLAKDGIEMVVVDPEPTQSGAPAGSIVGRGTEAKTLHEAGISDANVIVAASNDDANNLSVMITAHEINKEIYTIGRVNNEANQSLFEQANCDYIMRRSQLIANEVLTSISRPLVSKFIKYSSSLKDDSTERLIEEIDKLTGRYDPITWRLLLNAEQSPALASHLEQGLPLNIGQICQNELLPHSDCLPLLLQRGSVSHLLPSSDTQLLVNDELLVCGRRRNLLLPQRLRENSELIDTLINKNPRHIPLLRWWRRNASRRNLKADQGIEQ
ncbi:MAG: voltage-gated potassium channel [Arenicella sp.]|jgi:voltage-gated potassium channel